MDIYHRTGINPVDLPFIPGIEGAGVVEEVGNCVSEFKLGDRVAYCTASLGSYCRRRTLPTDKLIPLSRESTSNFPEQEKDIENGAF